MVRIWADLRKKHKANSKDKIEARKARGYGILGEIGAML